MAIIWIKCLCWLAAIVAGAIIVLVALSMRDRWR